MKPYPAYKDSGIEWLGEIPEHWETKKIKYADQVIMGQSPSSEDYNIEFIGLPFLQGNADFTEMNPVPRIWCNTSRKVAIKDDILVSVRAPVGEVNIADQEYGIGRGLCALRAIDTNQMYLYYLLLTLKDELNSIATGSTYTAISVDDIKSTSIPEPSKDEQEKIANFLDHRTHLIDTLIEKKQKLIDLLKEYRTAIINQAVTKGLDPDVKMKDSGIEWLGEVPEHWEVNRLKYSTNLIMEKDMPTEGDIKISPEYVESYTGKISNRHSDYTGEGMKFIPGDILFNKLRVYLAKVLYVEDHGYSMGEMIVIRPLDIQNKYLFYLMLSSKYIDYCNACAYGVKQPRTSVDDILNSYIPVPEFEKQSKIVQILDNKTQQIDDQIEKEQKCIEYLKEYRTTLISEVVTGKVNVLEHE